MSMSKKDFIALADTIRYHNQDNHSSENRFTPTQLDALADFCHSQNSQFMRGRWMDYITGNCGKNGGEVKK